MLKESSLSQQRNSYDEIRAPVRSLCRKFDSGYWQKVDEEREYPEAFVQALTEAGWLSALIPEKYGGAGLNVSEASVILEEINRSGGNSGACHAQMYVMGTLLRHGSEEQKLRYLPDIAKGKIRLQSFAVTEPTTGSDTTQLKTFAKRKNDVYLINGQKVWTSRVQHSDLMILLARTKKSEEVEKRSDGLSVFLIDLRENPKGMTVKPIRNMPNHETNEVFFDDLEVPVNNLIGQENEGFRYILDGMNAERILIAAECIGDGYWFTDKATQYSKDRIVFDRPIGKNQGVQFPIARSFVNLEAANLMRFKAAELFDIGDSCGAEANMAKLLASEAAWEAANSCMQTFGGFGFASEYDVERKFRETRLYQVAPISTNLILAYIGEHVLGMPRSY